MPGIRNTMHEFKHGNLHSGSKHGPIVKDRKQAIAIALHQARQAKSVDEEYSEFERKANDNRG